MLVYFTPITDETLGSGSSGFTDVEGLFTLTTPQGKEGVYAGQYKLYLQPPLGGADDPTQPVLHPTPGLPDIYRDPSQTPLRATVPEGGGTIEVLLTESGTGATTKTSPPPPRP
jgi:hypothetical protein